MGASVRQLIFILQLFFPPELAVQQAVYVLNVLISLYPLVRLHKNQRREPRQPMATGWLRTIKTLLTRAFLLEADDVEAWTTGIQLAPDDLDRLYALLGLDDKQDPSAFIFRAPRPILSTSRLLCRFCPAGDLNLVPTLRRRRKNNTQSVWLLNSSFHWVSADLLVGHCAKCRADYYPDRITRVGQGRQRTELLEYNAEFIRVSKSGIWVHRKIAVAQEKALHRFHSGWSNFADWVNDTTDDINVHFTYRQSQRLFLEHFSRRLLIAHGKGDTFECDAHSTPQSLAAKVREKIGMNGGVLPFSMSHGCMDCTHVKRYREDLIREGVEFGGDVDVVGSDAQPAQPESNPMAPPDPALALLPAVLPQQEAPGPNCPRGYCRLCVMDGKTLKHWKCALDDCKGALHLSLRDQCGIVPCGRPVHSPGALTCDDLSHIDWHKQYEARFHRLSFPGVRRVIRRQNADLEGETGNTIHGPSLQVQLQALGETPGEKVIHTFKAKSIYCLQTVQWACGVPIGWGKCYRSESTPQVLAFLNKIWDDDPDFRPSFIVYDKACDLLRHVVTQDPSDLWIKTTKFVVDAWHYIGHQATDILCRTRCNPAPTNGSQPDLVLTETDDHGVVHQTRAFNTETAEQLNSWLDGFDSQLRQMTDVNFDFFVHVLMLIYAEAVEKRIVAKGRGLSEEFWDAVNGSDIDNMTE
ncbi:hypothetical protein B0H15DRAFT_925077 [Mycena belliarum]|uniref:CxC5 like cysteine cluster associated with KDZ domain-containing protein n=1 Tax=Mycena belliarum TaxID=1033014 RepID=A0AAD6TTA9_9AGAR|nr:hypothetical protein B0H15DRAFT_925077 [Mycena belliae]